MIYRTLYTDESIELGRRIAGGGEGEIFLVNDKPCIVAKIYHTAHRTEARRKKLLHLLEKEISVEKSIAMNIAFPLSILKDQAGNFAGYIMPKIDGYALRLALFSKSRVKRYYPELDRVQLVEFAIGFAKQVRYLHRFDILIGDINPLNLLVDRKNPSRCWLIDTDSFQVGEFPCPVGTDLFTPPRLQGCDFKYTLRTQKDENFSMAIMLFMILMLGKHPYAKVGGGSPAYNMIEMSFPYPRYFGKMSDVPKGVWGFIWSHFNRELKEAFYDCFTGGECPDADGWIGRLKKYRHVVSKGYFSRELYPNAYRAAEPTPVVCEICGETFEIDRHWREKLASEGKHPRCAGCQQKIQATILAKKSRKFRTRISDVQASSTAFGNIINTFI
jgi:DNA-binding helix-hairpin-helix protein with protein kinase domain